MLLAEQLRYVSTSKAICQELFSNSFKFLFGFSLFCCPRGQLAYISTSILICQVLFFTFFDFLLRPKRSLFRGSFYSLLSYSVSLIRPYPPSFLLYTTAKAPPLSSSRKAKKLWSSRFICITASSLVMGLK